MNENTYRQATQQATLAYRGPQKLPPARCPECRDTLNAVAVIGEGAERWVREGELTICIACGTLLAFCEDTTLRRASEVDLDRLPLAQRRQVESIVATAREMAAERRQ